MVLELHKNLILREWSLLSYLDFPSEIPLPGIIFIWLDPELTLSHLQDICWK
jgi:hypothetical protein